MKPEEKFDLEKEENTNQEIFDSLRNGLTLIENLYHQRNGIASLLGALLLEKEKEIARLENEVGKFKESEQKDKEKLQSKNSEIDKLKNTILNKDNDILDLNNKLIVHANSIHECNETINTLRKEKLQLEEINKENSARIEELKTKCADQELLIQGLEKENQEKDSLIKNLKIDSNELERQLSLHNEFLTKNRSREEQVCDQLSSSLKILSDQIETKDFVNSSFSKIGFDKEVFANLISSFIEIKEEKFDFWSYLNYSFSDHLFDLLIKNKATFSKIFKLYSYARAEKIQPDLKNVLNVDLFVKTLTTIQNLFSVENIHLYYPLLLFDKYTSENYDLEDYNMINQINESYTNSFEYNTIIDLEQVGIIFKAQKIKPKVSKKN